MQGDLISKSVLIEELQKYFVNNTIHKNDLAEVLANMPCAYSVEKVVAETDKVLADLNVVEVLSHFEPDKTIQKPLSDFLCAFKDEIGRLIRNGGKE